MTTRQGGDRSVGLVRATERGTRIAVALVGGLLAVLAGYLGLSGLGWAVTSLSYDLPFLFHRGGGGEELCLVYLDEVEGGSRFLEREPQAALLEALDEAGVKAVVYDVIFDRASEDPAVDEAFAAAIRTFRGVGEDGEPIPGVEGGAVFLACGRETENLTGVAIERLIPPTDALLEVADDFGLVAYDDEVFMARRLTTGSVDEPSLTWKAAAVLGEVRDEESRAEERWINFVGSPPGVGDEPAIIAFSASNILDGDVHPSLLRDKIVVVGGKPGIVGTALGVDLFETPFHRLPLGPKLPLMSGVELQANQLANLLNGNWLTRTRAAVEEGMIWVAGLLVGVLFSLVKPVRGVLVAVLLVVLLVICGAAWMHFEGVWFPWSVVAFLQVPVALVWGSGAHFYVERFFRLRSDEAQERLREAFARYLSPAMLDRLTAEGFEMELGGEKVWAAMVFTDVERFTDMCQRVKDPQRIVETMNGYFERTTGHIFDADGVVIKFIGDAIFAAWGVPIADENAAEKALRAAWRLFMSAKLVVEGEELRTRIGVHFGEVVAGNVGSSRHIDYTLIGDDVNLAARLEGMNKMLGTSILFSGAIRERVGDGFRCRRVGKFLVKGRDEVTEVFELVGMAVEEGEPEWIAKYHVAIEALEKGDFERGRELLEEVRHNRWHGGDGPATFLLGCLERGEVMEGGVVRLREK